MPETSNLLSNCSRKGSEARGQHCGKPAPEKSGLGRQSDELGAERRRECDGWLPFSKVFNILGVFLPQLAPCQVIPPISLLRRMSVKPPEEEKGIFKRKKTTEPVMVFSFAADEAAGVENQYVAGK